MPILLVDGLNLIYRAFHAYPATITNPSGRQANAVVGVVSMLHSAATHLKVAGVIVAGERGPSWRHDEYAEYKGGRSGRPPELDDQIPHIARALKLLGVATVRADGHEADDIIATLTTRFTAAGREVLILSNDLDLWQLSAPGVAIVQRSSDRSRPYLLLDRPAVELKLGHRPEQLPDYKALVGEKMDNLPGVPGIGPKNARELLAYYGRLEAILDDAPRMGGIKRARLMEYGDQARRWRRLATLTRDIDLPEIEVRPWLAEADLEAMERTFPAMGLGGILPALRAAAMRAKAVAA